MEENENRRAKIMKDRLKGVIAVIVVILTVFAWFVTVHGVGSIDAIASKIQRGLDIEGGVYVVLEAQDTEGMTEAELQEAMEQTQAVIENRVDQLGLSNPVVSIEGTDRIRVELPGMENAEEAIALIGQTAQLQFCLADGTFILDGGNVKNASISTSSSYTGYVVKLEFDSEGTQAFTAATEITASGGVSATLTDSSGTLVQDNAIVIMLDDEVISAPVATSVINQSTCIIEGSFTQSTATNLAALIRGGALPIQLEEISSGSQTATIGLNAFENSLVAGIIGLIIIFLLMIFFYRIMGLAADLALALYVVLILMLMAAMGSVLTLPGIAGIILSVGMAVDANVIIFNRIKEEIAVGKTIRVAVQTGYKRALGTVLDSQITTLIATVILYQLGTSAVKGFAWTLMIGILVDIFTAVFITQLFLSLFASSKRFATNKWFAMKEDGTPMFALKWRLQVIKNRKICYLISTAIIVVGLLITATIGLNQGIDFTGGTMLHVDMHTQVAAEDVKDVAAAQGINVDQMEIVFTGTDNEEIIIKTNETLVNEEREQLISALEDTFGITEEDVLESEYFGPSVGKELTSNALKALFFAAVGMLIYIRIRFREWRFGAAALIGVLHDCLILMAFYAIFRVTVNNPFIAAILTVVWYSVSDNIVIIGRIREIGRLLRII